MEHAPPHLAEKVFRRWENFLKTAASNLPDSTTFSPPLPVAPTTLAARIRDSLRSVQLYNWSTDLTPDQIASLAKFNVHIIGDSVYIGTKPPAAHEVPSPSPKTSTVIATIPPSPDLAMAAATLANADVLTGVIRLRQPPPELISSLLSRFPNIGLHPDNDTESPDYILA